MSDSRHELAYQSQPTRWQRWRGWLAGAGVVAGSHFVAAGFTLVFLVFAGGLFGVISAIMTIFTPAPGGDGPGAMEAGVGAIIMGVFFAIVGGLLSILLILAGIVVDSVRRPLRMPWWLALGIVAILLQLGCVLVGGLAMGFSGFAVRMGVLWGLGLAVLFCVYWVPMGCAGGILQIVKWGFERIVEWWQERRMAKAVAVKTDAAAAETAEKHGGG